MARPRKIVLCEESESRARALIRFLERDPDLEVVRVFGSSESLLSEIGELEPDLISIDFEMIERSTIERIGREEVPILVLGGDLAKVEHLADAIESIPEERLRLDEPEGVWATAIRSRVKRLSSLQPRRRRGERFKQTTPPRAWRQPAATYHAIGIGASVGGPSALATVLGGLPSDFPLPVLVVQHMAKGFGEGLTKWLDENAQIGVGLAIDGAPLAPGVWVAPDGAHLRLDRSMRLSLDRKTRNGPHRPSLDALFESLASAVGEAAVGVVLTGMGRDGAEGVGSLRKAGGLAIAQDEKTSAVFGMPGAAIEAGVDLVLPLEELAPKLATLRLRRATP